jgi:hypothetical protein
MVHYNQQKRNGELVRGIVIDVSINDAAAHALLLKAITTSLRLCITSTDKTEDDEYDLLPLIDLLEEIIPDEHELEIIEANKKDRSNKQVSEKSKANKIVQNKA